MSGKLMRDQFLNTICSCWSMWEWTPTTPVWTAAVTRVIGVAAKALRNPGWPLAAHKNSRAKPPASPRGNLPAEPHCVSSLWLSPLQSSVPQELKKEGRWSGAQVDLTKEKTWPRLLRDDEEPPVLVWGQKDKRCSTLRWESWRGVVAHVTQSWQMNCWWRRGNTSQEVLQYPPQPLVMFPWRLALKPLSHPSVEQPINQF